MDRNCIDKTVYNSHNEKALNVRETLSLLRAFDLLDSIRLMMIIESGQDDQTRW